MGKPRVLYKTSSKVPADDLNLRLKQFALHNPSTWLPYWSFHYTDCCSIQTFYVLPTRCGSQRTRKLFSYTTL